MKRPVEMDLKLMAFVEMLTVGWRQSTHSYHISVISGNLGPDYQNILWRFY